MLTKILILGGAIAAAAIMIFRQLRPMAGPPPQTREKPPGPVQTVKCAACGAWHLSNEPCLCGHSSRD